MFCFKSGGHPRIVFIYGRKSLLLSFGESESLWFHTLLVRQVKEVYNSKRILRNPSQWPGFHFCSLMGAPYQSPLDTAVMSCLGCVHSVAGLLHKCQHPSLCLYQGASTVCSSLCNLPIITNPPLSGQQNCHAYKGMWWSWLADSRHLKPKGLLQANIWLWSIPGINFSGSHCLSAATQDHHIFAYWAAIVLAVHPEPPRLPPGSPHPQISLRVP